MKKLILLCLIIGQINSFAQSQDPYDRNKPDTPPNGRNGVKEKPSKQDGKENDVQNTDIRANRQQNREVDTNPELISAAAEGLGPILSLLKDEYSPNRVVGRIQIGVGATQLPLVVNAPTYSTTEKIYTGDLYFGLHFGLLKNKSVSFDVKGFADYKFASVVKGNSGVFLNYGGTLTLFVSPNNESAIKVFGEIGYNKMKGEFKSDGSDGDPFDSALDFAVIRLGGGIKLHIIDLYKETWIKPGFFLEKPSFLAAGQKPISSFNLQVNIQNEVEVDFSFSKNYYIGGTASNSVPFINKNQNMFTLKLIRNGKIF